MNYEEKYKETYDKAIGYKVLARKEAYEAKAKGYVLGLGGPFISKEEYEASILLSGRNTEGNRRRSGLICSAPEIG